MSTKYIQTPGLKYQIDRFNAMLQKANPFDHILIRGPRGTGKSFFLELFQEHPKGQPEIVRLNCATFGSNLIDSELYGYVKGAFTDAKKDTRGHLETAGEQNKIIVLEEFNSLSIESQAKLLVYLETYKFFPVGGRVEKEAELRIIAIMNTEGDTPVRADLTDRFRIVVDVPPLHNRREDILHFIAENSPPLLLSPIELLLLLSHNWPGNIRELRKTLFELECMGACEMRSATKYLPSNLTNDLENIRSTIFTITSMFDGILRRDLSLSYEEITYINKSLFGNFLPTTFSSRYPEPENGWNLEYQNARRRGILRTRVIKTAEGKITIDFHKLGTEKVTFPAGVVFTAFKLIFGDDSINSNSKVFSLIPFDDFTRADGTIDGIISEELKGPELQFPTFENNFSLRQRLFNACQEARNAKILAKRKLKGTKTTSLDQVCNFILQPGALKKTLLECVRKAGSQSSFSLLLGLKGVTLHRFLKKLEESELK
ncbi:AAA family ATPase [Desulfopila sp. IMCC35006]|uniref:sigma 54-interacting transcriptional regulator n=1 Tax=Desulfopila sp. IMCC35006 TaxID=2569542 RepID=UPI0010ACCDDA|nr:sigma 54-interacting transcriptional regulator [Desulfopila sp. IMCC35006]TKB26505.1 AAA family ATPase [Desulfopila sp. IMCC35006]